MLVCYHTISFANQFGLFVQHYRKFACQVPRLWGANRAGEPSPTLTELPSSQNSLRRAPLRQELCESGGGSVLDTPHVRPPRGRTRQSRAPLRCEQKYERCIYFNSLIDVGSYCRCSISGHSCSIRQRRAGTYEYFYICKSLVDACCIIDSFSLWIIDQICHEIKMYYRLFAWEIRQQAWHYLINLIN